MCARARVCVCVCLCLCVCMRACVCALPSRVTSAPHRAGKYYRKQFGPGQFRKFVDKQKSAFWSVSASTDTATSYSRAWQPFLHAPNQPTPHVGLPPSHHSHHHKTTNTITTTAAAGPYTCCTARCHGPCSVNFFGPSRGCVGMDEWEGRHVNGWIDGRVVR